jgi:ATP-dependent Clp protease adaptor protein ClpS
MSSIDTIVKTQVKTNLKEPSKFRVIYLNDEVTTMDFVIESLVVVFHLDRTRAEELTIKIHQDGSAVAAVLPYEIAEQKGIEVSVLAKKNGFPLVIKLEPDE